MINVSVTPIVENIDLNITTEESVVDVVVNPTIVEIDLQVDPNMYSVLPPFIEKRLVDVEGGLIQFNNALHTEENPFVFQPNETRTIPVRNDSGIYSQAPAEFQNLIDNQTNSIQALRVFDVFDVNLLVTVKSTQANRTGEFDLDIGGNIGAFNDFVIKGGDVAGVGRKRTINKWFYQGSTFKENGGIFTGSFDGYVEMYDIKIILSNKSRGADIS